MCVCGVCNAGGVFSVCVCVRVHLAVCVCVCGVRCLSLSPPGRAVDRLRLVGVALQVERVLPVREAVDVGVPELLRELRQLGVRRTRRRRDGRRGRRRRLFGRGRLYNRRREPVRAGGRVRHSL